MLLAMGIHRLPSVRDYWSLNALLGDPGISRGMTHNRFLSILSHLHINDNSKMPNRDSVDYDKLYTVRRLLDRIRQNSQAAYYPHQQLAVGEVMILLKSRSTIKKYMPLKPTKRGYRCWCSCHSTNGYLYNFDFYAGNASTQVETKNDGLASRVVKSMVEPVYNKGHHIYTYYIRKQGVERHLT